MHMRVHVGYYTQADAAWMNLLFDESVCAKDLAWLAVCDTRGTGKPRENADREEAFVMDRLASYERIVSGPMPDARRMMAAGVSPGPGMKEALADAYAAAETVDFDGKYLRHDIGRRAMAAMEER